MSSSLVDLKLGRNKTHGPIPDTLCTAKKLHDGMTSKYGCDAILRPLGTYCTSGYATPTSECKPCPSGQSSLHLGFCRGSIICLLWHGGDVESRECYAGSY